MTTTTAQQDHEAVLQLWREKVPEKAACPAGYHSFHFDVDCLRCNNEGLIPNPLYEAFRLALVETTVAVHARPTLEAIYESPPYAWQDRIEAYFEQEWTEFPIPINWSDTPEGKRSRAEAYGRLTLIDLSPFTNDNVDRHWIAAILSRDVPAAFAALRRWLEAM